MIRLIAGLGNPGPEYAATRHNAGFWFVDEVADRLKVSLSPERSYFGLAARANVGGRPLWLLEPTTFMNLSGKSVAALARFFKIEPGEILVAHDELDLMPGQVKLKLGGSHAGHNGLKDIHAQLGSGDYWRLRIGIGHPGVKSEVINYVLKKPSPEHRVEIQKSIEQALSGLDLLLDGDMERATMKINARPPRPKPEKPDKTENAKTEPAAPAGAHAHGGRFAMKPRSSSSLRSRPRSRRQRRSARDDLSLRQRVHERRLRRRHSRSPSASAVGAEQRAEAREVARREKALAAEMARDRRADEARAQARARGLAERAARGRHRGRAGGRRSTPKKHRKNATPDDERDFVADGAEGAARPRASRARRRRLRRRGGAPRPAGAGTSPRASRSIRRSPHRAGCTPPGRPARTAARRSGRRTRCTCAGR